MNLRLMKKGAIIQIKNQAESSATSESVYEVKFNKLISDNSFLVEGIEFYQGFTKNAALQMSFLQNASIFTFSGKAKEITLRQGEHLTLIEKTSDIVASSRRQYYRDDIRATANLYGSANSGKGTVLEKTTEKPEFSSMLLDISAGGFCLGSNELLNSTYEPYFLVEFTLNNEDLFLLPATLLRKGNCPQTALYRHDYGFMFVYEDVPEEKDRLATAILKNKLESVNRS